MSVDAVNGVTSHYMFHLSEIVGTFVLIPVLVAEAVEEKELVPESWIHESLSSR